MKKEDSAKEVYSQVAPEINELYEYYRKKKQLEEENDLERQLEVLIAKKYISDTFLSKLNLLVEYYERGMEVKYLSGIEEYKRSIKSFILS